MQLSTIQQSDDEEQIRPELKGPSKVTARMCFEGSVTTKNLENRGLAHKFDAQPHVGWGDLK
jgi:hypothetical protein